MACRRLYTTVDWTAPQYYSTNSAVVLGNKVYYFTRGPDAVFFAEFDTVTSEWRALQPYSWLTDQQGWDVPIRYETIRLAAVGSEIYVYGRGESGTCLCAYDPVANVWTMQPQFAFLRDVDGFAVQKYARTVRLASLSPVLYLLARNSSGFLFASYHTGSQVWTLLSSPGQFTDDLIWSQEKYYASFRVTIQDNNTLWLYGRGPLGINLVAYDIGTGAWSSLRTNGYMADISGWSNVYYYETTALLIYNSFVYIVARGNAAVYSAAFNPATLTFTIKAAFPYYKNADSWYLPQYYYSLRFATCDNAIYSAGRGPDGVYTGKYVPNVWSTQPTNVGLMTNANGWNVAGSYRYTQWLCIGNDLYYVGRHGAEVAIAGYTAGTWTPTRSLFSPCANTCLTCDGDTGLACLTCFLGSSLQGPTPNACICPAHMYLDTDVQGCVSCHARCEQCIGKFYNNCSACQANAHLNVAKCDCDIGFYWGSNAICTKCALPCTQCSNASLCTFCVSNAAITAGMCLCSPGYFFRDSSVSCSLCDSSCLTCTGPTPSHCSLCRPGAILLTPPISPCACALGFFPVTLGSCQSCDPICLTCDASSSISCLSCPSASALTSSRSCQCIPGYYRYGLSCVPCDQTCARCKGPGETDCMECWESADIQNNGICLCKPGFFPAPTSALCPICPDLCETCNSILTCLTCGSNAELDATNICKCISEFGVIEKNCEKCPEGCRKCGETGCSECCEGFFLYLSSCVKECPTGFEPQLHRCLPSPLHVYLANSPSNLPTLHFSQSLSKPLSSSDFSLSVSSPLGVYSAPSHVLIPVTANQTYNLSLHFSELPPDNSTLSLVFLSSSVLVSAASQQIVEKSLSVQLFPYSYEVVSALSAAAIAAAKGSVTSVAVISLITGTPATLFSLISQLQLVAYIPLLSVDMPQGIVDALAGLNSNELVFSPFKGVVSSNSPAATPTDLPQRYGFTSTLFLSNSSFILLGALGLGLSYPLVSLLAQLTVLPVLAIYFRQIKEKFQWDYPVQWWLQVYMDVGVNALVQFATLRIFDKDPVLLGNAGIAGLFLVAFAVSPFLVIRMMGSQRKAPISGLGVLYAGLKPTIRLYFPLFLFRRLIYAVILVELGDYPALQSISSTIMACSMLIYLLVARPYIGLAALSSPIIGEATASSSLFLVSLFLLVPVKSVYGKRLEQAVLGAVLGGVLACGLLALCQLLATGKEVVTTFRRIAKELKAVRVKSTMKKQVQRRDMLA